MLSMLSIFLEMKLAFQNGIRMLCSKARALTGQAHHVSWKVPSHIYILFERAFFLIEVVAD